MVAQNFYKIVKNGQFFFVPEDAQYSESGATVNWRLRQLWDFSQLRICSPPPPSEVAIFT